jgi:aldehyde dehydrogenase (NAD+)
MPTIHPTLRTGQSCIAGSRIYLQETIYDEFLSKFTEIAKHVTSTIGDPFAPGIGDGPLVSLNQFDVRQYIS